MHKVGDEIDGYCPRCRLNTYQNVAATDGRDVFSVTCRTCRNSFAWKPEISAEEQRAKAIKKLSRIAGKKIGAPPPEVVQRGKRKEGGDLDAPLKALSALHGRDVLAEAAARLAPVAASGVVEAAEAAAPAPATSPTERWRQLSAALSWRDGKPYQVTRTYKPGDVVLHKNHGLGIVQQIVHENACIVLFRDLEVTLEMGLPLSALER